MELRKKSLLIALALGDGSLYIQNTKKKGKVYSYTTLEVIHGYKQKEYLEYEAELCRKITKRKCNIHEKQIGKRIIVGKEVQPFLVYRFSCTHPYFKIIRRWMYPEGKLKYSRKFLDFLTPEGIAIWYMDNGSTYIKDKHYQCEISTYCPLEEAEAVIEFFKDKYNIDFHLHKKGENQYCIRSFGKQSYKFIKMIKPFVPKCMEYKVKIPDYYTQECIAPSMEG